MERHNSSAYRLTLAPTTTTQDILRKLVESGVEVEQFEIAAPTLDEIFIQVVQQDDKNARRDGMNKFWRIAWQEYSRHVLRSRFLFALIQRAHHDRLYGCVGHRDSLDQHQPDCQSDMSTSQDFW